MNIERLDVAAYNVPLEQPESDGTLTWDSTTVIVVEPTAGGARGLGFTYGPRACASVILDSLAQHVVGRDAMDVAGCWDSAVKAVRNMGRPGVASMAIAAVDAALWDLKAKLLDAPLARLLGLMRRDIPVYWSGGFTSYTDEQLAAEFAHAVHEEWIPRVKMKIGERWGAEPERDIERVNFARKVVGDDTELYIDANGGYSRKQAIRMARYLQGAGVSWFEEPVSSDDLEGLREIRDATDIDVAAGEYGYDLYYFERMARAVDVLQIDASRCAGISEWLRAAGVAAAHGLEVSSHTAQSLHAHPACSLPNLRHVEYFADHHRVDRLLFDGALDPTGGTLRPDLDRPGLGLELKRADAEPFLVESASLDPSQRSA